MREYVVIDLLFVNEVSFATQRAAQVYANRLGHDRWIINPRSPQWMISAV